MEEKRNRSNKPHCYNLRLKLLANNNVVSSRLLSRQFNWIVVYASADRTPIRGCVDCALCGRGCLLERRVGVVDMLFALISHDTNDKTRQDTWPTNVFSTDVQVCCNMLSCWLLGAVRSMRVIYFVNGGWMIKIYRYARMSLRVRVRYTPILVLCAIASKHANMYARNRNRPTTTAWTF